MIWSDECTFMTGKQKKAWVIHTKDERYCQDCMQHRYYSGRTSFSVWAAVGWNYKSELVILDGHGTRGGMSMEDYKYQVLDAQVISFFVIREDQGYIYVEDGNKAHGRNNPEMQHDKADRGVVCIDEWPPSSPDFNIIENIWRLLKQRLKVQGAFINLDTLKAALREEWERLTQEEIRNYIISLPWRMEEALERNGLAARF